MSEELKPCPFCGVLLIFKQPRVGDDYHEHPRNDCVLAGDYFIADPITIYDAPEAIAAWNRRPEPAPHAAKAVEMDALDAKRYRWLRDEPWPVELQNIISHHGNAKWDAAIDAAMSAQGGKG